MDDCNNNLYPWWCDSGLILVLPPLASIGHVGWSVDISFEKDGLGDALIRVDPDPSITQVTNLDGQDPSPFGFHWGTVDEYPGPSIGALANDQTEDMSRDVEGLQRVTQDVLMGHQDKWTTNVEVFKV